MDMSQYDMFLLCAYRYRNRYKLDLAPITKGEALDRGTIIHVGCEAYYDSLKSGAKYEYAVDSALLKMKAAFVSESDLSNDEANRLLDVMEEYFDYWRVADQGFEILGVEESFMDLIHEDEEIRLYLAGKIDLITSDDRYPKLVRDHKSFSRSGPVNEMSNQFKNYCHATGTVIMEVNRIGLQKTLKPHEKFLRVPISYTPDILESWRKNVVANIMWYLQCEASNVWPTNETSCDKFNRRCEYYDVCTSSGEEAKQYKLMTDFKKTEPWDVTKILKRSSELVDDRAAKLLVTKDNVEGQGDEG